MKEKYLPGLLFLLVSGLMLICATSVLAADKKDMGGWGIDDAYNKMYNAGDVEKMKVVVTDIKEVVPMPGMSPGVALIVREGDDEEEMLVHLCPVWYKKANRTGIRKGDKLKLRGYFTEIDGKEVIMAAKIKFNGKAFKVRLSSDGTPFWTMTPAQLQKELSDE